jgi:hypothetical protein
MSRKSRAKYIKQNPNSETKQPSGEEKSTKRHVYVEPGVQIDFVKDLKDQHETNQTENRTQQKKQLFWTRIAAGLILLYTAFSGWQVLLTNTAINDGRQNFIKDHAPYIWVTPEIPVLNLNEPFRWDFQYSNYGRSPALELHSCAHVGYRLPGFSSLADMKLPVMNSPECKEMVGRSTTVVPPGFPVNGTVRAPVPLQQTDIEATKSVDGGALILGVLDYTDATGHNYESAFCAWRLITGAVLYCEKYNYIKQVN